MSRCPTADHNALDGDADDDDPTPSDAGAKPLGFARVVSSGDGGGISGVER
jgi:hypothetical protein